MFSPTEEWHPSQYASKKSILIVGDMDLSFITFLMPYLSSSTVVVNSSLLSEFQLINSTCGSIFLRNKAFLLAHYGRNIQIKHEVNVRSLSEHRDEFNTLFDCVLFIYPQATNSSEFIKTGQYDVYHSQNAMLLKDYLLNATHIIWDSKESQIDFVVKRNHIRQWIEEAMPSEFLEWWRAKFEVRKMRFSPVQYNGYTSRNERGLPFDPGASFLISSTLKALPTHGVFCDGLNIEFVHSERTLVIGQLGCGRFDLRRDYKKAVCREANIHCANLASVQKIYFVNCVARIEGELYSNGESIEFTETFRDPTQCVQVSIQTFAWLTIDVK